MRLFVYKSFVIFIAIYLLYNFTIGKKIDDYEKKLVNFATDEGREKLRNLIRKEIKNTIDNENVFDPEDRVLVKRLLDKIKKEVEDAKNTFRKYKWPTIDVTRKSVEETAASIIKIYEIFLNKKNG